MFLPVSDNGVEIPSSKFRVNYAIVTLTIEHWNLSRDRLEQFVSPDPLPIDILTIKDRKHAV